MQSIRLQLGRPYSRPSLVLEVIFYVISFSLCPPDCARLVAFPSYEELKAHLRCAASTKSANDGEWMMRYSISILFALYFLSQMSPPVTLLYNADDYTMQRGM